jgi:hypothetical protein
MAIKQFDRDTVKQVREEIEKSIKEACDRLGIKPPTLGNITFDKHTIHTAKLVFGILTPPIDRNTAGLMGQVFKQGSGRFKVIAIHEDHVTASSSRGKHYRISYEQLNTMMTDADWGMRVGKQYGI